MKITVNVDCTPEEARRYMGLPDVAPMQQAMLKDLQECMMSNFGAMQPSDMIKLWMPMGLASWQEMHKAFWAQMTSIATHGSDNS
jgi:hypothetical protein